MAFKLNREAGGVEGFLELLWFFCQYRFYFALRFDYDDPQFRQNVEDVDALFNYLSFTMPENFLPILEYLPGSKVMKK